MAFCAPRRLIEQPDFGQTFAWPDRCLRRAEQAPAADPAPTPNSDPSQISLLKAKNGLDNGVHFSLPSDILGQTGRPLTVAGQSTAQWEER